MWSKLQANPNFDVLYLKCILFHFRAKTAVLRDQRIKLMNEVICGMRVIKMYAWEHPFAKLVGDIRR